MLSGSEGLRYYKGRDIMQWPWYYNKYKGKYYQRTNKPVSGILPSYLKVLGWEHKHNKILKTYDGSTYHYFKDNVLLAFYEEIQRVLGIIKVGR